MECLHTNFMKNGGNCFLRSLYTYTVQPVVRFFRTVRDTVFRPNGSCRVSR